MPSQKQEFSFPGLTTDQLLIFAYGAFLELRWTPKFAGPLAIVGYTPRSWNKYDDEIMVEATDGGITVTSSLVHNESFDLMNKNKRHIQEFITTFERVRTSEPKSGWNEEIEKLRQQTVETVREQTKQTEEINKVMNFSSGKRHITYTIIGINILVFVAMIINGVSFFEPTGYDILHWGANYKPLTLTGDWWRLVTCTFIHIGIIHLVFNMYALYMAGVYLEPMLGKIKYAVAYLCTGVFASIGSLVWHKEPVPSAGASGAIFGMYGVFLALLLTNLIPKKMRSALLQSIGVFVVFNLVYGMKAGVDNAAHVGGLISGMIIGFVYYLSLKKGEDSKRNFITATIAIATIVIAWFYLDNEKNSVTASEQNEARNLLEMSAFKDGEKFIEKMNEVAITEDKALAPLRDTTLINKELAKQLNEISTPEWDKINGILNVMKGYNVSENEKKRVDLLLEYVTARKEEIAIINKISSENKSEDYNTLSEIRERINGIVSKLNKLN
jgi:rhomboid protease GluP